jgi:predicted DNA-binding protein with PD1-like motif
VFVVESRHARRLVVRVDRGEEVIASIQKLAASERFRAAWIRGTGHVEWVDLVHWDALKEIETRPRRIEGPLLALSVEGNVSMRLGEPFVVLRGSFSREHDAGLQVVGGQVAAMSALALEVTVEIYEDARLERDEDPPTGLSLWKGERTPGVMARSGTPQKAPPPREPPTAVAPPRELAPRPIAEPAKPSSSPSHSPSPALGWAQVAAVSEQAEKVRASEPQRASRAADDGEEPVLQKGDWIEHRQFGLCRVDGEDAEGALIIKLPSGMRKHIKLDFMEVLPPRHDGERRIYPLRPKKR